MGEGPTRNRLAAQAAGEYVWFCDCDDELAPGSIARIAEILRVQPVDYLSLCYGARPDDPRKARLELDPISVSTFELLLSMPCGTWAKVVRTILLRDKENLFPPTRVGTDLVQSLRTACNSRSALFWYAKPYWVRRRSDSASGMVDESFCNDFFRSISLVEDFARAFPAFRNPIGVQMFDFWNYLLRRLRDEAPPGIRKKWMPLAKKALDGLVSPDDTPLLRIPRSFSRRENAAVKREREAVERERRALARERDALNRERKAIRREQALRGSLSWRLTMPLRGVVRLFAHEPDRETK